MFFLMHTRPLWLAAHVFVACLGTVPVLTGTVGADAVVKGQFQHRSVGGAFRLRGAVELPSAASAEPLLHEAAYNRCAASCALVHHSFLPFGQGRSGQLRSALSTLWPVA